MLPQRDEVGARLGEDAPMVSPSMVEHPLGERGLVVQLHQVRRYFLQVRLELATKETEVFGLLIRELLTQSGNRRPIENGVNGAAVVAIQFFPNGIHSVTHFSSGLPGRFISPVIYRRTARRIVRPTLKPGPKGYTRPAE